MDKAKVIKLFPAPHIELRVHVSEDMAKDYFECKRMADSSDFEEYKDCSSCSWDEVQLNGIGACTFDGVEEKMEELYGKTD